MLNINLLPWREKVSKRQRCRFFAGVIAIVGIAIFIIIVWNKSLISREIVLELQNKNLQANLRALNIKATRARKLMQEQRQLKTASNGFKNLQRQQLWLPKVLVIFGKLVLTNIKFRELNLHNVFLDNDNIKLEISGESSSYMSVVDFVRELQDSKLFDQVMIKKIKNSGGYLVDFAVAAIVART